MNDGSKMVINLGGLYKVKGPYKSVNWSYEDINSLQILAFMVIGIRNSIATTIMLCIDSDQSSKIGNVTADGIQIQMSYPRQDTCNISNDVLIRTLTSMVSHSSYDLYINELDSHIRLNLFTAQFSKAHISDMDIIPLNTTLMDMRVWPRLSLTMWAEHQLELPSDQLDLLGNINERWKYIEEAQELFTHQCCEYNKVAKKKVDEYRKQFIEEMKKTPIILVGTATDAVKLDFEDNSRSAWDHMLQTDDAFITDKESGHIMQSFKFRKPTNGSTYDIKLVRREIRVSNGAQVQKVYQVLCYINDGDKPYHTLVNKDGNILQRDFCIVRIGDGNYFIHIKSIMCDNEQPMINMDDVPDVPYPEQSIPGGLLHRINNNAPGITVGQSRGGIVGATTPTGRITANINRYPNPTNPDESYREYQERMQLIREGKQLRRDAVVPKPYNDPNAMQYYRFDGNGNVQIITRDDVITNANPTGVLTMDAPEIPVGPVIQEQATVKVNWTAEVPPEQPVEPVEPVDDAYGEYNFVNFDDDDNDWPA